MLPPYDTSCAADLFVELLSQFQLGAAHCSFLKQRANGSLVELTRSSEPDNFVVALDHSYETEKIAGVEKFSVGQRSAQMTFNFLSHPFVVQRDITRCQTFFA